MDVNRIILIVMDSAGIGELPDAADYHDQGSNTLGNISRAIGGLKLPNMEQMGLGNIESLEGVSPQDNPTASYGKMAEVSKGKDTTTGHWEIAGVVLNEPFPTYPHGFPLEVIKAFEEKIGKPTIGNKVASGTEIIAELGEEHMKTGYPIVYTSADSVFQIAAHEEIIPIEELYHMCEVARDLLVGEHAVGRVIARPFMGKPGDFKRTERRHDYSLKPLSKTILDYLKESGLEVMAVGKIKDIYAGEGVTSHQPAKSNMDGVDKTLDFLKEGKRGLIFTNLVEFDMVYGHRNNAEGYADALADFDRRIPEITALMEENDILVITADHGCDPTTASTDHSREYVPLLVYGKKLKAGVNLGVRSTFADLGATVAAAYGIEDFPAGKSFLQEIIS